MYAGEAPEVGILPVELTDAGRVDPVMGSLEGQILTLQWHGDTFDLPVDAVLLAGSAAYPHQAFRYGPYAYGVQFHIEVSAEMAEEWAAVPAYAQALEQTVGAQRARRDDRGAARRARAIACRGTRASSSAAGARSPRTPRAADRR